MRIRRTWQAVASLALIVGGIVAVATSGPIYDAAFDGPVPALSEATPVGPAPLSATMAVPQISIVG